MKLIVLPVLLFVSVAVAVAKLPCRCPNASELRSDYVKGNFDVNKIQGFWYELAMKDITQPRICKCQTSNKTVNTEIGKISDLFTIECYGEAYPSNLSHALTTTPGVIIGSWNGIPLIKRVKFPNTIVDVGVNNQTGDYEWIIEFQCIPGRRIIRFYAFNFYSKEYMNMTSRINIMEQSARKRSLGPFIDTGRRLTIIDHTNCKQGH